MLHERINLKDLEKFESIKLRLKKENIGIELSIVEDELLIDVEPTYQKPTKSHICEKEKFNHIMEECDKLDKKELSEKCKKYDEKCHGESMYSKRDLIRELYEKSEAKHEGDYDSELSLKLIKDYLKTNKISREKLCEIFQDLKLDNPIKHFCDEKKAREEHPFIELLKLTSNKNKSSIDFEDINKFIVENDELENKANNKPNEDISNIFKKKKNY